MPNISGRRSGCSRYFAKRDRSKELNMGRKKKAAGDPRKSVKVKLLERKHGGKVTTPYKLMEELIATVQDHSQLKSAKIAIAWRFGAKADIDGRLWLGQTRKGSDLDRALHGFDFVLILNHEVWNSAAFSEAQMVALIDHELSHCAPLCDKDGGQVIDEEGRKCWRTRKHLVEEFPGVIKRRGLWSENVRDLVAAAAEFEDKPILKIAAEAEAKRQKPPAAVKSGLAGN